MGILNLAEAAARFAAVKADLEAASASNAGTFRTPFCRQRENAEAAIGEEDAKGGSEAALLFVAYAACVAVFRSTRHPAKPRPAKPSSSIAQLDISGTARL